MKCNVLKRALVLTALGASMATAAFAAPTGSVMIPQPGTVVIINHNPDVTFAGNINFDVESQENNNLRIGSAVVPNVLYGAVFNKAGAPDTIVFNRAMGMASSIGNSAKQSKVYTYMKDHYLNMVIVAKDYDDNGARGSGVLMVSKQDNSDDVMLILFKGPDITNAKIEKVIGSMLSAHFERK